MTTAARRRRRPLSAFLELPPIREVHPPAWFDRLPRRVSTAGLLVGLLLISGALRSRQLGGQLWFNEALATGIASHSLSALPGVLRNAGSSPLYYVVLHIWIQLFGATEVSVHGLSVLLAQVGVLGACWVGWSLGGRRSGLYAAVLFALSSYLTRFANEAQPYSLLMLLGLLTTAGFLHAFVYRRRRYLWLFAIGLTALLYTQPSAALFAFGALSAFGLVWRMSPDRTGLARDGAIGFGAGFILYLPWLPTTIYQIGHVTAGWHYAPLLGADVPADLLGGERVDAALLVAAVIGFAPFISAVRRRTPDALTVWALIALPVSALILARFSTLVTPGWVERYFGPMVACLLLIGALGAARARIIGLAVIVLIIAFNFDAASFVASYKSDLRDLNGEVGSRLHAQDLVVVAQPEQVPLAAYYLPSGLRYASTIGPVTDPTYMNWSGAQARLQNAAPAATAERLIASLSPGQQLLFVRPLTEGVQNWKEPWTKLVRRRSAQWGQILSDDVTNGTLKSITWAPHNYRGSCCVASSATLYQKAS